MATLKDIGLVEGLVVGLACRRAQRTCPDDADLVQGLRLP
jgi:hypothetical protein